MGNEPNGGIVGLILAKIVCCAGVLLFFTGAFTLNGIRAWLFDGGLGWLVLTATLVAAGLFLVRQRKSRGVSSKAPTEQFRPERP